MDSTVKRTNLGNIIAASIMAFGLITAALILIHRPQTSTIRAVVNGPPTMPVPPITQSAAAQQFRKQVLAAPSLHTLRWNHVDYTLTDLTVTQVIYASKDDQFTIVYNYTWLPAMRDGGPQTDSTSLSNDGYGHYSGPVVISPEVGGTGQNATVTIR